MIFVRLKQFVNIEIPSPVVVKHVYGAYTHALNDIQYKKKRER